MSNTTHQLELIDAEGREILEEDERQGVFTAQRFRSLHPERYQLVVQGLASGVSRRQLARLCRCSRNTVQAVEMQWSGDIEPVKKRMANTARVAFATATERILEDLQNDTVMANTGIKDKAIVSGILRDTMQVLSDAPTHIIGRHDGPDHSTLAGKLDELIQGLPQAEPAGPIPAPDISGQKATHSRQIQPISTRQRTDNPQSGGTNA
jgi:hypothetical protein